MSNSWCCLSLPSSPVSFAAGQSGHPQPGAQAAQLLLLLLFLCSCHSKSKLWTGHSPCWLRGVCKANSWEVFVLPASSRFQAPPVGISGYQMRRCQGRFFSKNQYCWEYWSFVLVLGRLRFLWSFKALFIEWG